MATIACSRCSCGARPMSDQAFMEPAELCTSPHGTSSVHGLGLPWKHPAHLLCTVVQDPCAATTTWDKRWRMPMPWSSMLSYVNACNMRQHAARWVWMCMGPTAYLDMPVQTWLSLCLGGLNSERSRW